MSVSLCMFAVCMCNYHLARMDLFWARSPEQVHLIVWTAQTAGRKWRHRIWWRWHIYSRDLESPQNNQHPASIRASQRRHWVVLQTASTEQEPLTTSTPQQTHRKVCYLLHDRWMQCHFSLRFTCFRIICSLFFLHWTRDDWKFLTNMLVYMWITAVTMWISFLFQNEAHHYSILPDWGSFCKPSKCTFIWK